MKLDAVRKCAVSGDVLSRQEQKLAGNKWFVLCWVNLEPVRGQALPCSPSTLISLL